MRIKWITNDSTGQFSSSPSRTEHFFFGIDKGLTLFKQFHLENSLSFSVCFLNQITPSTRLDPFRLVFPIQNRLYVMSHIALEINNQLPPTHRPTRAAARVSLENWCRWPPPHTLSLFRRRLSNVYLFENRSMAEHSNWLGVCCRAGE